jgi:hypothetical protein
LALESHSSGEYHNVQGLLQRSHKPVRLRGLNENHNHDLKGIFKAAAVKASSTVGPFEEFYAALVAQGMKPTMARLTLARKDRYDYVNGVEERSAFRRRTTKTARVGLNVSVQESAFSPLESCLVMRHRILETLGFEGAYPSEV